MFSESFPGFESQWMEVDGARIHMRRSIDPPESLPVVLMHGLGVSSRHWMPAARLFAENHPVFAPDLPGYGISPRSERALSVSELADLLGAWMDDIGVTRAAVLGVSFGCQVVVDLAAHHPEKVAAAALLAPTMDPEMGPIEHFVKLALDGSREPLSIFPVIARDYFAFGVPQAIATFNHAYDDDVLYEAAHVDAPTLVIRGGRDPIVSQEWCERLVAALPDGHLEVIPGAAHATNFNSAERVRELFEAFLERVVD